jgi:hypothetical protein
MEIARPFMVPVLATVTVSNVLPSGAAFAVRNDDGTSCYVPTKVGRAVSAKLGSDFVAKLVPNTLTPTTSRVPWLAIHLADAAPTGAPLPPIQYDMPFEYPPEGKVTPVIDRVRALMQGGDVWTVRSLHDELGGGADVFAATQAALAFMFSTGECAKFAMWHSAIQRTPTREWYTCHPERADVAEWEADEL